MKSLFQSFYKKSERIDYARRLERIESLKARERQATSTGGLHPQLCLNSDRGENKRTDEVVAHKLGIGGKDTYRKEKYIVDNQNSLSSEDFANWDELFDTDVSIAYDAHYYVIIM